MRLLVTGADGFVGRHLCRLLRAGGDEVVEAGGPYANAVEGKVYPVDVTAAGWVHEVVAAVRPEGLVHLAGQSSVGLSHRDPSLAFSVNGLGTANVLAAVHALVPRCRVLVIGSGEMYGAIGPDARATEDAPLRPASPYAASKVAAEVLALQFHRSYGTRVVCARPFSHIGPGQDPGFVVPAFAAQLASISRGKSAPSIKVGNLEPVRDFLHVADVTDAYQLLLHKGEEGGVYNVCSGEPLRVRALLDLLLEVSGVAAKVEVDPARVRAVELPRLVGDPGRLEQLGWVKRRTVRSALVEVLAEAGA